ncbi:unnamed protein product, partial [Didymodactylos carnosus]
MSRAQVGSYGNVCDSNLETVRIIVRDEDFELSCSLYKTLIERSSITTRFIPVNQKQSEEKSHTFTLNN